MNEPTARGAALAALGAILSRHRPLDETLEKSEILPALDARDRAFARLLIVTVLRRLGQIDALIDLFLEKPLPRQSGTTKDALRLGVAQLLFIAAPPHAVVDTAVELSPTPFKGLVNAVLRRVVREGEARLAEQDAARLNVPDWLWRSWEVAYGEEKCRRIAEASLNEPPLDLSLREDPEIWAERLSGVVLPTGSVRIKTPRLVEEVPGYKDGIWWVQDAAAALPIRLLGPLMGRHIVDLCAAPGGKTAQLLASGAQVMAIDRSAPRVARLLRNLDRLKFTAEVMVDDAGSWRPSMPVDAVLLDAPCSATGTLRRHPDILRLRTPDDVTKLAHLQMRLLKAAFEMVKPGGTVVYCVCSLQDEEGPDIVERFLIDHPDIARAPIQPAEIFGLAEMVTNDGDLRTLPFHLAELGGMDAFYAARLRKRED
jgi:16S rRNA (cytosine967-C5)-methyltransferase